MARRFRNRKPSEWRAMIAAFGYKYIKDDGDDQIWKHDNNLNLRLLIPARNKSVIIISTADYMLRNMQKCNVATKKEVLAWWKNNGYGE